MPGGTITAHGAEERMDERPTGEPNLRLAEFVASLSLATDLGLGQPMEWTGSDTGWIE